MAKTFTFPITETCSHGRGTLPCLLCPRGYQVQRLSGNKLMRQGGREACENIRTYAPNTATAGSPKTLEGAGRKRGQPGFLSSFYMRNVCLKKKRPLTEIRMLAGFEARGEIRTQRGSRSPPSIPTPPHPSVCSLFDQPLAACEGLRGGDRKTEGLRTPPHRKGLRPPRLALSC